MKILTTLVIVAIAHCAVAQRITVTKGSVATLKGVKSVQVKFTYDDMTVGKDLAEEDYIRRKTKELNDKEPRRGDTWAKAWVSDRERRFEPAFKELFEKYATISTKGTGAKYLLVFHTVYTEPGFNVGVARRPALINAEVSLVDAADESKVLAVIQIDRSPGNAAMGFDYDTGLRIEQAYAKAGKELGQFLTKKNK